MYNGLPGTAEPRDAFSLQRGRSCLMYVVDNYKNKQSLEIVDYLLEKKIDITTRDVVSTTRDVVSDLVYVLLSKIPLSK